MLLAHSSRILAVTVNGTFETRAGARCAPGKTNQTEVIPCKIKWILWMARLSLSGVERGPEMMTIEN